MIEIICDKCERSFAVEDVQAGGKVACPSCGDINRVPAVDAADGPAAAGREPAREPVDVRREAPDSDRRAERQLAVVRPAMAAHPFRFLLILVLVIGGMVLAIWGWQSGRAAVGYLGLVPVLAGAIWLFAWWLVTTLWIKVTITNKRTVRHEGIIRRHSTEVLHDHVRSVDINQNFIQRIMKVGYIGIDSAGQDGIEIEIRDIPGPYEIKKLIDQYRKM